MSSNEQWWVFAECVADLSVQKGLPDPLEETLSAEGLLAPFGGAVSCNAGPVIEVQVIVSAEGCAEAEEDAVEAVVAALRGCGANPDSYQLTASAMSQPDAISMFPSIEQIWGPA